MWTRQELKARGKAAFKRNYWRSVGAGAVTLMVMGASAGSRQEASGGLEELQADLAEVMAQTGLSMGAVIAMALGVLGVSALLSMAFSLFLSNPFQVGARRFFLKNAQEPVSLKEVLYAFRQGGYLKIVAAKFLQNLFITLWCLLLVIPGIIKAIEYSMVDYILADNPDIRPMDALRESKQMMKGNKWKAFVLGLSFLGWELLSLCTFGLLDVFYVRPYIEGTFAELYLALKQ